MVYNKHTIKKIFALVMTMGALFCLVTPITNAAWIHHELPKKVVIGNRYEQVLVNLTTEDNWQAVSSGTLYWGNPDFENAIQLDRVKRKPFISTNETNLADGYENFYFDFIITEDMARANHSYSFYIIFNFTYTQYKKFIVSPITAVIGLVADFSWGTSWTQFYPMAHNPVQFKDASEGKEEVMKWVWDFGDGKLSAGSHPTHTYSDAGTYNVTLTVTDADGETDSVALIVIALLLGIALVVLERREKKE